MNAAILDEAAAGLPWSLAGFDAGPVAAVAPSKKGGPAPPRHPQPASAAPASLPLGPRPVLRDPRVHSRKGRILLLVCSFSLFCNRNRCLRISENLILKIK